MTCTEILNDDTLFLLKFPILLTIMVESFLIASYGCLFYDPIEQGDSTKAKVLLNEHGRQVYTKPQNEYPSR